MRMWGVPTRYLCNRHLLGEHVEHHMFVGCLEKGKNIQGYLDGGLFNPAKIFIRHNEIVTEMIKRGMNHKSGLSIPSDIVLSNTPLDLKKNMVDLKNRCIKCRKRIEGNSMRVYGINFDIEKTNTQYRIHYHGVTVAKEDTKKKVIAKAKKELYKRGRQEIISLCASKLRSDVKNKLFDSYGVAFKAIFDFDIPMDSFLKAFSGKKRLDVIALDRVLHVPDGISIKMYIKSKYGDKVLQIVQSLI